MVDQLIEILSVVCNELLPILGVLALIFLCVFLRKTTLFIQECTKRMQQLESTVEGVDKSIEKIQTPLDSVVKLSKTVDNVAESTENAVKQAASFVANNLGSVKDSLVKSEPESTQQDIVNNPSDGKEGELENA